MRETRVASSLTQRGMSQAMDLDRLIKGGLIVLVCLWMTVAVVFPVLELLVRSLSNAQGEFTGLANFSRYFRTPALAGSLTNSLTVSFITTMVSVSLGFLFAYALTRTAIPGKTLFLGIAMVPVFAPTLLNGIVLVYLFGKKGVVTTGAFGLLERVTGMALRADIGLYGPVGIILAEAFYTFPQVVLILSIALRMTDARLYEAAQSLGASPWRSFISVTLPGIKYGLISAVFVSFILCFTDFGAPKVVGGNYNVLATDIYKQVIGQQNFSMGATVSVILLIPTVIAFAIDRFCQGRQQAVVGTGSLPYSPRRHPLRDALFLTYCIVISCAVLCFLTTALFASLVNVWPYDFTLTWKHYHFHDTGGGGYAAFFNSVRMSFYTALLGTCLTFGSAYLLEKLQETPLLRRIGYFLSIIPLALPGLVIGLAYIFFLNNPHLDLPFFPAGIPNPFNFLYGTMGILILCNIVHFYTVSFLTATTALKQLEKELEMVSESMGVPFYRTCFRVTVPVCLPAILEIALYYFVNSMATVSAVIFLYSAEIPLASVAVANMDDAGDVAPAAAMSMLIVFTNILVRLVYTLLTRSLKQSAQAWTAP